MSRPREFDHVIVGGGLAAASAVDGIRDVDAEASIAILTEEAEPPYQRPPLSKEYLQVPELPRSLLHVKPEGWFEQRDGIDLFTRERVLALDPGSMSVTTARGGVFRGGRILLATGGRARLLRVPGADLPGVLRLRTVEDAEAIREAALAGRRAVLVGAGFIGMELAASLTAYSVQIDVIEAEHQVWPGVLPPELAGWFRTSFEARGISFHLGTRLDRFLGDTRVSAAVAGGTDFSCDFSVIGIGLDPCDALASDAGLAVADGILVDAFAETSHPHVYAAGDAARFPDPATGSHVRVEHWEHAREHGRLAGRNMAGARETYEHLSHVFSRVFDVSLEIIGDPRKAEETAVRGSPGDGPCYVLGCTNGRLSAIVLLDASGDLGPARGLVRASPRMSDLLRALDGERATLAQLAERYARTP